MSSFFSLDDRRGVLRHLKRPAAPECASRTPCSAAPSPPAPVFDFRAHFCHSAPMETHAFGFRLRANAPEGQKRFPINAQPSRSAPETNIAWQLSI
jgi:hypothetical protein